MNRKKKALLLSCLASLAILSGCSSAKNETIQIDGETYIKSGEEYTKVDVSDRTFAPGEHILHYVDIPVSKNNTISNSYLNQGFNNGSFFIDEVPDGYKLVGVTSYSNNDGYNNYIVYIFVNEKTVIVHGSYDEYTNEVVYETPGTIIEDESLELVP